ncbi:MAG: hypothetical protein FWE36_08740 [Erysipelotrichales bacterium]|nr:hypothetical protein [Erysipelotrichales bacterium]
MKKKIFIVPFFMIFVLSLIACNLDIGTGESNADIDTTLSMSRARFEVTSAPVTGGLPIIIDSATDGINNFYLIDGGMITNVPIASTIPITFNGVTPITVSFQRTTISEENVQRALSETVSHSVATTRMNTAGVSVTSGTGSESPVNLQVNRHFSRTWGTVTTNTNSTTDTFATATSISESISESITFTIGNNNEPVGDYRLSLFAIADIYFIITTSLDNNNLLSMEAIISARTTPEPRFGLDFDVVGGNFGKTATTEMIDFPEYFWRDLPSIGTGNHDMTLDFSNALLAPPQVISIANNLNSIRIIGRGINHVFNTHVMIENRINPLRIIFQDFAMQAPIGSDGIRSTNSNDLHLFFQGSNNIIGGQGAGTGAGRNGIYSVGTVNVNSIGTLRTSIIGGRSGTSGNGGHGIAANHVNLQGVFNITGGTGGAGADNGNPGGRGGDGGRGITAANVNLQGDFHITGGTGGTGGTGANRGSGVANHGRTGGAGGSGGTAIYATNQVMFSSHMRLANIIGGLGGVGGRGGNTNSSSSYGGWGGAGGRGGHGIEGNVVTINLSAMELSISGGAGGAGGGAGQGFRAAGQRGRTGATGGQGGHAVYYNNTIINNFSLLLFQGGNGGAGGSGGPMRGGAATGHVGSSGAVGGIIERKR